MAGLVMGSAAGSANSGNSFGPYFEYSVLPLQHNLDQKGGTDTMKSKYFLVGDYIEGVSPYDDKIHQGKIQRILKDENGKNNLVYILTDETEIIPVKFDTIKRLNNSEGKPQSRMVNFNL